MDEYDQGWDPDVKRYLRKILNSFGLGALWLLLMVTLGFAFRLAIAKDGMQAGNYVFYGIFFITLALLLSFYYKTWRRGK